jgi:hypothetical protein
MKKVLFLFAVLFSVATAAQAQKSTAASKWSQLTDEEKIMKAQGFREDNQAFLKDKLKLSDDQRNDIDNVNLCYIASLDRIDRYGKDDATKEKWAKTATAARGAQLDVIMGPENHKKYQDYVVAKVKKAAGK